MSTEAMNPQTVVNIVQTRPSAPPPDSQTTEPAQPPQTQAPQLPQTQPAQLPQTQPAQVPQTQAAQNDSAKTKKSTTPKSTKKAGKKEEEEEGVLKRQLGTDHYMNFLICVFCPWWLLIWIALCVRDVYKGTCCKDDEIVE